MEQKEYRSIQGLTKEQEKQMLEYTIQWIVEDYNKHPEKYKFSYIPEPEPVRPTGGRGDPIYITKEKNNV